MKLSSRKQLLKESDTELNKIRLRILLESDGEVDTEKIEKVAQKIADKKTEKMQSQIEKDLRLLLWVSKSAQKDYEKAKRETGVSIEEWYKSQPEQNKNIYAFERYYLKPYSGNLWDKSRLNLQFLAKAINPEWNPTDASGKYMYDLDTGKRIEVNQPVELTPTAFSFLRSIIKILSI